VSERRPDWTLFRQALDAEGFRPSKGLGQNFLVDPNAARAIVRDAEVEPGARVLEVGMGCGLLTVHLVEAGARLVAVEIDARLVRVARRLFPALADVQVVLGDVLAGKDRLAPAVAAAIPAGEPWRVVSNLPYGVAGPLLYVLARLPHPPCAVAALVQLELARRAAARPGTPDWGQLGAKLSPVYRARLGRRFGPEVFRPRPRVESALVHLELRAERPRELAAYDALVGALFQQRRKTVRASLAALLGDREAAEARLRSAGIDPGERPERLDPAALQRLAAAPEPGEPS
jgi:16S rRNA (adenine1518-N6/adenine1519-N6)-dimethyltransferase